MAEMGRSEAITLIMASAFIDTARAKPHPLYRAFGGGYSPEQQPGAGDTVSMSVYAKTGRGRRDVELALRLSRPAFAAVKENILGLAPDAVWASSGRFWGPVLFDRNADPDAPVHRADNRRELAAITNGQLEGAVDYAAQILVLIQKDPYVRRCIKAMKYAKLKAPAAPAPHLVPERDDATFFRHIRDILGPDAVPQDYR